MVLDVPACVGQNYDIRDFLSKRYPYVQLKVLVAEDYGSSARADTPSQTNPRISVFAPRAGGRLFGQTPARRLSHACGSKS